MSELFDGLTKDDLLRGCRDMFLLIRYLQAKAEENEDTPLLAASSLCAHMLAEQLKKLDPTFTLEKSDAGYYRAVVSWFDKVLH